MNTKDRLIVALDVPRTAVKDLVISLRDTVGMFKIGSQLFTSAGPDLVREIVATGSRVFLDLKFHDIPHQVALAARAATQLGVSMFTVHASGGTEMMRRAMEAVAEEASRAGRTPPAVVAVTVLTSLDADMLAKVGVAQAPMTWATNLAKVAEESGVNGVVASAKEVRAIRAATRDGFLIVTPGIRPAFDTRNGDDQKRVATPSDALGAGADYLVIGRPITGAKDPFEAARRVLEEMQNIEAMTKGTTGLA